MTAARRTALALCLVLLTGAGCGTDSTSRKEPAVTPDEANSAMTRIAREVMGVVAPGDPVDLNEDGPPTPCGGLGGNEYTKIKYGLNVASATAPADSAQAFDSAAGKLEDLGYTVQQPETMGDRTRMVVKRDGITAELLQNGTGPITLGAETPCLKNPDGRR